MEYIHVLTPACLLQHEHLSEPCVVYQLAGSGRPAQSCFGTATPCAAAANTGLLSGSDWQLARQH